MANKLVDSQAEPSSAVIFPLVLVPFVWRGSASKVSVMIWESGLDIQGRQVPLSHSSPSGIEHKREVGVRLLENKLFYKFKADGNWFINPDLPCERHISRDPIMGSISRTEYNVLTREQLSHFPSSPSYSRDQKQLPYRDKPRGSREGCPDDSKLLPHPARIGEPPVSPPLSQTSISALPAQYPYRRLDFDTYEVRLLKLTWEYSKNSPLSCSLEHVSLIDPGSYFALSYCWGAPLYTETIKIDAFDFPITASLASALEAVRKKYLLTGNGLRIWVDALCINQENNEERSHQVRIMRQIYSKASKVLCWAGDNQASGFPEAVNILLRSPNDEVGDVDKVDLAVPWTLLDVFFSQPYWRRVWVIQEIAVASKAQVMYGDFHMPWDIVSELLKTLSRKSLALNKQQTCSFRNALHLLEFRDRFLQRQPFELLQAIQLTHQALATDPRDKIFALLGLCHDSHHIMPLPNYRQPLETIIADMIKVVMVMNRSLDLMCLKGTGHPHKYKVPGLPSWAPNFVNFWSGSKTIQEENFADWNRTYDFNPVLAGSNNQLLKARGRFLCRVSRLGTSIHPDGRIDVPTARAPWLSATSTLAQHNERLLNPTATELALRDFIWQTLVMSMVPIDLARACFSSLWKPEGRGLIQNLALISWIDQNAWFQVSEWTLREWSQVTTKNIVRNEQPGIVLQIKSRVSWEITPEISTDELMMFIETLDRILGSGMKLAVLQGTQSLGLVHPDTEVNDEIYLLHGCTIPVVLRRADVIDGRKTYHVVGGAYSLGTDPNSYYYQGTKTTEDLLNWEVNYSEELEIR
jgi:hypothetical protein